VPSRATRTVAWFLAARGKARRLTDAPSAPLMVTGRLALVLVSAEPLPPQALSKRLSVQALATTLTYFRAHNSAPRSQETRMVIPP